MLQIMKSNIYALIKNHFLVVAIFTISIFASILTLFYSLGSCISTVREQETFDISKLSFTLTFDDTAEFSKLEDSVAKADKISGVDNVRITLESNDADIYAYYENSGTNISFGSYFNDDDSNQIIIGNLTYLGGEEIGSTVTVQSVDYLVVGKMNYVDHCEVNFSSLGNSKNISEVTVILKHPPSTAKKNSIYTELSELFPNAQITVPESTDYFSDYASDSSIYVTIALVIMALVNISYLYNYLLRRRKNTYAIYQICGCTKLKGACIFLLELLILSIIPFIAALLIYRLFLENYIINDYIYIYRLTNLGLLVISLVFLLLLFITFIPTIISYCIQTPKQLQANKG
ncbi:MAG: hypothetical protein LUE12_06320 [Ruminococcus sp.]|nr:hypothetical protein [Ruminococcus sp.]